MVAGSRFWDSQSKFRVIVGPLTFKGFERFCQWFRIRTHGGSDEIPGRNGIRFRHATGFEGGEIGVPVNDIG